MISAVIKDHMSNNNNKITMEKIFNKLAVKVLRRVFASLLKSKKGRSIFYKAYPKNNLLVVNCKQEYYIVNTSDSTIGFKTFVSKQAYDSPKLKLVISLLPETHSKTVLVDIGANIGSIGIHAVLQNHFSRAIAFEPEPHNFHLLKSNVSINGLDDKITLYNLALSNNPSDTLQFELSPDNHGDHRVHVSDNTGLFNEEKRTLISVNCDIMDNYTKDFDKNSALIWIDTQGYEGFVFSGASETISRQIPICMEFWPYGMKRSGCYEMLIDILANSSYEKVIDLSKPGTVHPCSRETFSHIADSLGFDGKFTDILII